MKILTPKRITNKKAVEYIYRQMPSSKQRVLMIGKRYQEQKYLLRWNFPDFCIEATIIFLL